MSSRMMRAFVVLVCAWLVLVALLVLCGEGIKHSGLINSADKRVTSFVIAHRTPWLNDVMKVVTWAGSWVAVAVVAVVIGAMLWRRHLRLLALAAVLASWVGELLGVTLVKRLVERDRPPEALWAVVAHGWAFPSGHAANAVVVFATAAALAARLSSYRMVRVLCWASGALLVALVGFSRIELGVHWATDVVAGAVWASGWTVTVVAVMRRPQAASDPAIRSGSDAPLG
jgi:membrane-associated phospholipid phosphatase